MSILIDADARDRTSTGRTFQVSTSSYKPISVSTVQLVELTDECIEKIAEKVAQRILDNKMRGESDERK